MEIRNMVGCIISDLLSDDDEISKNAQKELENITNSLVEFIDDLAKEKENGKVQE